MDPEPPLDWRGELLKLAVAKLNTIEQDDIKQLLARARDWKGNGLLTPGTVLFGTGIVVGVAAGVLFAPKTGTDTRRRLMERFRELQRRLVGGASAPEGVAATVEDKATVQEVEATVVSRGEATKGSV